MLNGLSYEDADGIGLVDLLGTVTLDTSEREPTLVALSIDGANGLFVIDSDTYVPIYATGAISYGPIQATQGWNISGDTYALTKTTRSSTINSILQTTPAWNGVLVGKVASEVIEPSLTPFAVGDRVTAGDKYVFDTTKEAELLALAQSLEGSYNEQGQYVLLGGSNGATDRTIIGLAKAPGDTPTYVLMVSDGDTPVFAWSSAELQGMGLTQGWQSNMVNGEYTITSASPASVTTINNGEAWNGIIVGKA